MSKRSCYCFHTTILRQIIIILLAIIWLIYGGNNIVLHRWNDFCRATHCLSLYLLSSPEVPTISVYSFKASRVRCVCVWNIRFGLIDLPYQSGLVLVPSTPPQDESFIINVCTYTYIAMAR